MTTQSFMEGLAEALQVNTDELTNDFRLTEENWDSMAIVSVVGLIDEHYDITVSGEALLSCRSIGELVHLIEAKKADIS